MMILAVYTSWPSVGTNVSVEVTSNDHRALVVLIDKVLDCVKTMTKIISRAISCWEVHLNDQHGC